MVEIMFIMYKIMGSILIPQYWQYSYFLGVFQEVNNVFVDV